MGQSFLMAIEIFNQFKKCIYMFFFYKGINDNRFRFIHLAGKPVRLNSIFCTIPIANNISYGKFIYWTTFNLE